MTGVRLGMHQRCASTQTKASKQSDCRDRSRADGRMKASQQRVPITKLDRCQRHRSHRTFAAAHTHMHRVVPIPWHAFEGREAGRSGSQRHLLPSQALPCGTSEQLRGCETHKGRANTQAHTSTHKHTHTHQQRYGPPAHAPASRQRSQWCTRTGCGTRDQWPRWSAPRRPARCASVQTWLSPGHQ